MGVRLIGLTTLVAAGLVLGIVLASGGGPGEGPSEPSVAATPESPEASDEPPVAADVAESPPPEPTTLLYNRQDTTGAAAIAGSYAFLETAGDAASAITTFEYGYSGVVELRIHPTDAGGTSRAAFYDTVQVGDSFDYQTEEFDCGFRFKVTSIAPAATPRTFGIEYSRSYGGWCDATVDDSSDAKPVLFVWRVPAGVPGPDGVRQMLPGEPVGPGTYRVSSGVPWVFDVPPGMQVMHYGPALGAIPAGAPPGTSHSGVMLIDTATDSRLGIDLETGRETRRIIKSPEVSALFDQIMASIRRVGDPPPPPEPTTLRYDRLDITGAAASAGSYAFLNTAGDPASAIYNFGNLPTWSVELRIHPDDASGASHAAFYDTVQVGDRFDDQTNGLDCGFRFKVTSVGAAATPRTLGVEYVRTYGGWCGDFVDDPGAAKDVQFVWKVPPGVPGPGGVRELLLQEPAGPGTYRIHPGVPWAIDVPAGMQVILKGILVGERSLGDPAGAPGAIVVLLDAATDSVLGIDPVTGAEVGRDVTSIGVHTLFDHIMASIRRVE